MKISEQVNTSCSFLRRPLDSTGKRCNIKKSLPEDDSWRCQKIEQNLSFQKTQVFIKIHHSATSIQSHYQLIAENMDANDIFFSAGCQ